MKKILILLLVLNSVDSALGQVKPEKYSKWYLKPAAGINIPISALLSGEITDNLIEYDDNAYYWQVISGNFFLSQKWGVEFTFQASTSKCISVRTDRFNAEIQQKYGEDYFIKPSSGPLYDDFDIVGGDIERGYLGIVYRIEKQRYIFLPKLFIGVTSFYIERGVADLKEKGTNTVLKLSYSSGKRPNDHFTVAPAFTFGYRLSKRFIANIDLLYSYYKTDIKFTEEIRNTFTEETSYKTINYNKNIHTLTIGIGLILEVNPVPIDKYGAYGK